MSAAQFRYSLQLSQGTASGLTYVNVGQAATLTFVVSNAGGPVQVTSLQFGIPPFGPNATDLAPSAAAVTATPPEGWTAVPGTPYTYAPPTTNPFIGTGAVVFTFQVGINPLVGTAQVGIREVTSSGTAFVPPFPVTKMSADFVLTDLVASPAKVEPGGTVALSWTGTPGLTYSVAYPGGQAFVTVPSGGRAAWSSPAIQTNYPSAPFTVTGSVDSPSGVVSAQISTSVMVDVPQVLSFPQLGGPFFAGPVALTWQTSNADHCQLYANGTLIDGNAPANTRAGGYAVSPTTTTTAYALYAVKGSASVPASEPVTVVVKHAWSVIAQVGVPAAGNTERLVVSRDGSRLYCHADFAITVVDTLYDQVVWSATTPDPQNPLQSAVLSPDGQHLYIASADGVALSLNTQSQSWETPIPVGQVQNIALSPDGSVMYVVNQTQLTAVSVPSGAVLWSMGLALDIFYVPGTSVSPDGNWLYLLTGGGVWVCDLVGRTCRQVSSGVARGMAVLPPPDQVLFTGTGSRAAPFVTMFATPGGTAQKQFPPSPLPPVYEISGLAVDGAGGVYVSYYDQSANGTALYYLDPQSGQMGLVHSSWLRQWCSGSIAVNPASGRVYYDIGGNLLVFQPASLVRSESSAA